MNVSGVSWTGVDIYDIYDNYSVFETPHNNTTEPPETTDEIRND